MWNFLILATAFAATSASTSASTPASGHFERSHLISFPGYADAKACEGDKRHWKEGSCLSEASDTVDVKTSESKVTVTISTVAANAHTCDFTGVGRAVSPTEIRAAAPSDSGGNCEVTLKFANDGKTVNVTPNQNCDSFCGASVSLVVAGASKK